MTIAQPLAPQLVWRGETRGECLPVRGVDRLWLLAGEGAPPPGVPLPLITADPRALDPPTVFGVDARGTVWQFVLTDQAGPPAMVQEGAATFRRFPTDDWRPPPYHQEYPLYPQAALAPSGHVLSDGPRRGFRILDADGRAVETALDGRFGPTAAGVGPWAAHRFEVLAAGSSRFWVHGRAGLTAYDYQGQRLLTIRLAGRAATRGRLAPELLGTGHYVMAATVDAAERLHLAVTVHLGRQAMRPDLAVDPLVIVFSQEGETLYVSPPGAFRDLDVAGRLRPVGLDDRGWSWWQAHEYSIYTELLAFDVGALLADRSPLAPAIAREAPGDLAPTLGEG